MSDVICKENEVGHYEGNFNKQLFCDKLLHIFNGMKNISIYWPKVQ